MQYLKIAYRKTENTIPHCTGVNRSEEIPLLNTPAPFNNGKRIGGGSVCSIPSLAGCYSISPTNKFPTITAVRIVCRAWMENFPRRTGEEEGGESWMSRECVRR